MRTIKSYKTLTIFFLFLIGVVNYLDRSALSIANTTIQKDLAISPMQMGVMLSAFSIAYAFSQLPLGALIDKLGSKLALGGSLVVWSVAQAAFGLAKAAMNYFAGTLADRYGRKWQDGCPDRPRQRQIHL